MQVKVYIPHPALQQLVVSISTVDAQLPPGISRAINPYPPTPFQSLMFYCNNPIDMGRDDTAFEKQPLITVIGPQVSRVNIQVNDRLRAIRVDFAPGGMYRLVGTPMRLIFDQGLDAYHFFGPEMNSLNNQLQDVDSLEEGKNIVEQFLLKKATGLKEWLPFDGAMQTLMQAQGDASIEEIASLACLSLKQFERKCKERLGMTPKLYARILKFSKAYRLHEAFPHLSWTQIAHEARYFDQMHMIRDFKVFAGVNPSIIERELLATPLRMQKDLSC